MKENIIDAETIKQIKDFFIQIDNPTEIILFTQKDNCPSCEDTRQLLMELSNTSDKLTFSVYDIDVDAALAKKYNIDKVPNIVIAGKTDNDILDYGVRYAGLPSGHEFGSLIREVVQVSKHDSNLSKDTRDYLGGLTKPIKFLVFFTPT
jgi:alkyl hydroperoxide reductase subunit AhpF